MKKLISILLVAVMLLGMFPATTLTASAAETTVEFALGANGSASHKDGSSNKSTYSETNGDYTLSLTGGTNMYPSSYDAKGNSCIKLGSSSKTGGFSFTVPADVTSVVIAIAKYKANTTKITVNGTAYTLSSASNDGAYDDITVDTSSTKTVSLTTVSGGVRAMVNTITYVIPGSTEPDVPACEHTNTTAVGEAEDPTCTETGITAGEKCADCGEIITAQEEIPANGHNYVDGTCSACGDPEPEAPAGYTLVTSLSELKNDDQVIVVANAKGTYYAMPNTISSKISGQKVSVTDGVIVADNVDKLLWTIGISNNQVSLKSGNNYVKYSSSTNLGSQAAEYKWTVTSGAADNTFRFTSQTSGRGLVFRASTYNQFGGYALSNVTATSTEYFDVQLYKLSAGTDEPECEHTNKVAIGEAKDPTCTETGITAGVKCADCEYVIEEQQTISAINHANKVSNNDAIEADCETEGFTDSYYCPDCKTTIPAVSTGYGDHNYVDGECSVCGEEKPFVSEVTLSLANGENRKSYSTTQQVYANEFITLTNDKAEASTDVYDAAEQDHARFYKGSTVTIVCEGMTKIVLECDGANYLFNLAESDDYTFTVNGTTVTVEFATAVDTYTFTMSQNQARVNSLTVNCANSSTEPDCEHTNTTAIGEAKEATCTETGITAGEKCADCDYVITEQEIIAKLPHNYVDGACTVCEAAEPERYYIAAYRNSEKLHYYMTSNLGDKSTKRYQAEAALILPSNIDPDEAENGYVFILIDNGDGTYCLQAEGIEGNNYLGWTSGNSGALVAEANALKLTMTITEDGYCNFSFLPEGAEKARYLALNDNTSNNYFAWYEGSQRNLTLIPIEEAEDLTATLYADVDGLTVEGNLTLDLNGYKATNVTATKIYACDTSATYSKAADGTVTVTEGTGTLTVAEGTKVVIDNTADVDGMRYIALNNKGTYTFHILEMKLSAVSLRTSAAGIYYKAIVNCDETLAQATTQHGIALSTRNMPGVDFATENEVNGWTVVEGSVTSGQVFTSGSVFGIFKNDESRKAAAAERNVTLDELNALYGEVKIYANAYIIVDGTTIMADTTNPDTTYSEGYTGIAWSLKDVMVKLNNTFTTLSEKNQEAVAKFYKTWDSAMGSWNLTAIADAAANLPA